MKCNFVVVQVRGLDTNFLISCQPDTYYSGNWSTRFTASSYDYDFGNKCFWKILLMINDVFLHCSFISFYSFMVTIYFIRIYTYVIDIWDKRNITMNVIKRRYEKNWLFTDSWYWYIEHFCRGKILINALVGTISCQFLIGNNVIVYTKSCFKVLNRKWML